MVFSPVEGDAVRIQAQLDYGRLRIKPGQDAATRDLRAGLLRRRPLGPGGLCRRDREGLSIKLPPQHRRLLHLVHGEARRLVRREAPRASSREYAAKNLKPFGFDFIQIDDGWQEGIAGNGPTQEFHNASPRWPVSRRA